MRALRTNHLLLFREAWGNLRHADWQGAQQRYGPLGAIVEFWRALVGMSAWPFFIPSDAGWEPEAVRSLFSQYGITNWGWGYHAGEYFCQVPMRQAHWAQYVLQQAGVVLGGRLLTNEGRGAYGPARRTTSRPRPAMMPAKPQAQEVQTPPRGPLGRIDVLVDRLADW